MNIAEKLLEQKIKPQNAAQRLLQSWVQRDRDPNLSRMSTRKLKREMKHRLYRDDEHRKVRASSDAELKLLGVTATETNSQPLAPAGATPETTHASVSKDV